MFEKILNLFSKNSTNPTKKEDSKDTKKTIPIIEVSREKQWTTKFLLEKNFNKWLSYPEWESIEEEDKKVFLEMIYKNSNIHGMPSSIKEKFESKYDKQLLNYVFYTELFRFTRVVKSLNSIYDRSYIWTCRIFKSEKFTDALFHNMFVRKNEIWKLPHFSQPYNINRGCPFYDIQGFYSFGMYLDKYKTKTFKIFDNNILKTYKIKNLKKLKNDYLVFNQDLELGHFNLFEQKTIYTLDNTSLFDLLDEQKL